MDTMMDQRKKLTFFILSYAKRRERKLRDDTRDKGKAGKNPDARNRGSAYSPFDTG